MAFAMALRTDKRLKMIDGAGKEEYEQAETLDTSYLALLDPNRVPPAGDGEAKEEKEEGDEPLNPMDAFEKFTTAKGELDVIVDLITNLDGGRYLDFRVLSNKPRRDNPFQELADESAARFGRHRAALKEVSARLRQGAAALRAAAARDNRFYAQATQLQRFWKLRLNPLTAEFADSPFSADISFLEGSSQQGDTAAGEAHARAASIPLVKHATGEVCMRPQHAFDLPPSQEKDKGKAGAQQGPKPLPPVGSRAVHRRLLQLQQRLLWQLVGSCLEDEARGAALNSNFSYSLASSVLAAVASPSPSRPMAALRPLVLEHIAVSRLPHSTITDPPRPYVTPLSSLALLPELSGWISHCFYRDNILAMLDAQVHQLPMVALHWVPSTQPFTSALQICLSPGHRLLLIITEKSLEVEGIASPLGTRSRWAREGSMSITKLEVPHLLGSLVNQAMGTSS